MLTIENSLLLIRSKRNIGSTVVEFRRKVVRPPDEAKPSGVAEWSGSFDNGH